MIEKFVDIRSVKKVLKMVKNFSQKFVFHGCGAWYHNGTNKIVRKNGKCICPSYEPFWKKSQTMFVIKLKQELNLN